MLPDDLHLLEPFDLRSWRGSNQANTFKIRGSAAVCAKVRLKVQKWEENLNEEINKVYGGTQQLIVLEDLADKIIRNRQIEHTRECLLHQGVRTGTTHDALDRLEETFKEILTTRNRQEFRCATLRHALDASSEMTPSQTAVITSNLYESITDDALVFLALPHNVMVETVLAMDDLKTLRKRIDETGRAIPAFMKFLPGTVYKKLSHEFSEQDSSARYALSVFKEMPAYAYSFADYNHFEALRNDALQRVAVISKFLYIFDAAAPPRLKDQYKSLIERYSALQSTISEAVLDKIIQDKMDYADEDDLFSYVVYWQKFEYPADFRRAGAYGDMTDEDFNQMTNLEAYKLFAENLGKLGLRTYGDFKEKRIFNSQMLGEYLSKPEIRPILSSRTRSTVSPDQDAYASVRVLMGVLRVFRLGEQNKS